MLNSRDGVAGLKIVGKVDGERRQFPQHDDLQEVKTDRAEQHQTQHPPQVRTCRVDHHRLRRRIDQKVDRDDHGDTRLITTGLQVIVQTLMCTDAIWLCSQLVYNYLSFYAGVKEC